MDNEGLKDALEASLGLEQKGYDHYQGALDDAKNPLTQELFKTLAKQELEHMKRIKELFETGPKEITAETIPADALERVV